jgi:hypothetical protein
MSPRAQLVVAIVTTGSLAILGLAWWLGWIH